MLYYHERGEWQRPVPESVHHMRRDVIQYMIDNRDKYVTPQIVDGRYEDPPLDIESFNRLIADQSRDNAWTDNDGFFVAAACQMYNVELTVIVTCVNTDILTSGLGGPLQIINKSDDDNRLKFSVGLIKNNLDSGGHFQFIFPHPDGENTEFQESNETFSYDKGDYYMIYIEFTN